MPIANVIGEWSIFMTENERKEIVYSAMKDIYKEFNHSVNNLIILREFLSDIMNVKEGKDMVYDFPSVVKYKNKTNNPKKVKNSL